MNQDMIMTQITDQINNLPLNLTVQDIAGFLGVCPATAYKLVNEGSFPKLRLIGHRRLIIPKHLFLEWYNSNSAKAAGS